MWAFRVEQRSAEPHGGRGLRGPPDFNTLYASSSTGATSGLPRWSRCYRGGRTVRFTLDPQSDIRRPEDRGREPVLYLKHASDPIVWWSPRLVLTAPDWLREPRTDDIVSAVRWIPSDVWQVTADLPFATGVRQGTARLHPGERRRMKEVVERPGWTDERTARLRQIIAPGG